MGNLSKKNPETKDKEDEGRTDGKNENPGASTVGEKCHSVVE